MEPLTVPPMPVLCLRCGYDRHGGGDGMQPGDKLCAECDSHVDPDGDHNRVYEPGEPSLLIIDEPHGTLTEGQRHAMVNFAKSGGFGGGVTIAGRYRPNDPNETNH